MPTASALCGMKHGSERQQSDAGTEREMVLQSCLETTLGDASTHTDDLPSCTPCTPWSTQTSLQPRIKYLTASHLWSHFNKTFYDLEPHDVQQENNYLPKCQKKFSWRLAACDQTRSNVTSGTLRWNHSVLYVELKQNNYRKVINLYHVISLHMDSYRAFLT